MTQIKAWGRAAWAGLFAVLVCFAALVSPTASLAHRPYFTQVEKVDVPDCRNCELRLLHGDGIFFRDPVQALLLDAQKNLLAKSATSKTLFLYCRKPLDCAPYDADELKLLQFTPSEFLANGPKVPGLAVDDRDGLWDFEPQTDEKVFGFSATYPPIWELIAIEFAMLRHLSIGVVGTLAAIGFGLAATLIRWNNAPAERGNVHASNLIFKQFVFLLLIFFRIVIAIVLIFIAIYLLLLFDGVSLIGLITILLMGAMPLIALKGALRRRHRQLEHPAS